MQKVLEAIQRVRFTKFTLRQASVREKKGQSLGKINVKVPHQRSPHALKNLRTDLKKRLKDKSDAPAATNGILPKHIYKLKEKGQSYVLFAYQ